VVAGVHVLSPGQKVSIYKEKGAVAPAPSAPAAMDSVAPSAAAASAAGK
jgi:multidrug efflux system membrane fusion protein